ncbi:hypothetical protein V6L77_00920 [Pannonibacter sp. Pt2-lr]
MARGDRLKERKALLVLRQEAAAPVHTPGEAAPLREEASKPAADQAAPVEPQKPEPEKKKDAAAKATKASRKSRLGFGELALLASLALVGWAAYDHFTSPYSGPLSLEAMAAVKVSAKDLAPREDWGLCFRGKA